MKANLPSESINAFAAEMVTFTSEKAFVCTLAPLVLDRVCDLTLLLVLREVRGEMMVSDDARSDNFVREKNETKGESVSQQEAMPHRGLGAIRSPSPNESRANHRRRQKSSKNSHQTTTTTNLEKVAVVRIGKAVCKANDMVDVLLFCVR